MEKLEPLTTLDVDSVMSNLGQARNPCGETLEVASGYSEKCAEIGSASEVLVTENGNVADISGKHGEVDNVEVENQILDAGKFVEGVEGGSLVGGVAGVLGNGANCSDVGGIETLTLVDEAVTEEKLIVGGSLKPDFEKKGLTVSYSSEIGNECGLIQEMCSTGREDEEAGVENVSTQDGLEEGDASKLNLVDSCNKVDDSGNGISLYVEVFGPRDGLIQGADSNCLTGCGLFGSTLNEENLMIGNDAMLRDNRRSISEVQECSLDENANDVEGNAIDIEGYRFNVGDVVWAKTKTQSWWPALICEPSDASKDAAKTEQKDCFLVRCFGSGSLIWCRPSQLKPFHRYFEKMSRESNSKSFLSSVEKAVSEIGRRVKLDMTCPCFPECRKTAVTKEGGEMSVEKAYKHGEFPVIPFEPATLLARIKCFAQDVSVPGMIDFTVIQNRLSAFYRSIGHHQLAMHQLKPTADASNLVSKSRNRATNKDPKDGSDQAVGSIVLSAMKMASPIKSSKSTEHKVSSVENDDGGTDGKSEKGYESRERRKSKYLSFPYIDLSHGVKSSTNTEDNETKDPITVSNNKADKKSTDGQSMGSSRKVKSSGKKSRKRLPNNPIAAGDIFDKSEAVNVSSTDMLSELRFTALDCLYPDESRHFLVAERFFSRFRKFSFRDFTHEIAHEDTVLQEFENEMHLPQTLSEAGATNVNKTAETGLNNKSKQKGRKKKEKTNKLGSSASVVMDFQKMEPRASESESVPRKRKMKAGKTPGVPQIKVMAGLPDLNGSAGFRLEGWNVPGVISPPAGKSKPKREVGISANRSLNNSSGGLPGVNRSIGKFGSLLKDVEAMGLSSVQNILELNNEGVREAASIHLNAELTANLQDVNKNAESSSVMNDTQQMGMLSPCGKPEHKKRKRKQKGPDCQTTITSAIPDLNGNASELRLQGNQLPEINCVQPEGKPKRKRRRKKAAAAGDAQINGDALGTALLLKFASEFPLPSKEDLVSKFCTFGPLKESETQVLNDSGSAQVVFTSSSDARNAFRSLEKNSPFGPALVNYRLHILLAASGASKPDDSLNMHRAWHVEAKSPRKPKTSKKTKTLGKPSSLKPHRGEGREAPDLQYVRQNLQMMTSMLENAGDNLSTEMRAKLESEIKSLLNKVSTMVGSSSSS